LFFFQILPNGLESVPEGWKLAMDGKVSGEKVAYVI
jgi:hypothetical protein